MTNSRNTLENRKQRKEEFAISYCISAMRVYRRMMSYIVFETASLEVV
jgi:hypothetical protein